MSLRKSKWSSLVWTLVATWLACGATGLRVTADEPVQPSEEAIAKKFQAYAKETAAAYKTQAGDTGDGRPTLREEPILRWTNPLGGRKAHGEIFLWMLAGRPAAVLSLYEYTDQARGVVHEHHELCSLALEKLTFVGPGKIVWSPTEAGVELRPLADAAAPAESPRQRLSQMRELAARFSAEKTTREGETRALRLLTQPVYRYEGERNDSLDGALFAFVEATDPEVFLLLETRPVGKKQQWHYALARMNSVQLRAALDEKPIWEAAVLPWSEALNRKDKAYTAFTVR